MPVGGVARRADRLVVGVAQHQHVPLDLGQRLANAAQHRQRLGGGLGAARREEAVAAQAHHGAVGLLQHGHQALADLGLQEALEAWHLGRHGGGCCHHLDARHPQAGHGGVGGIGAVVQRQPQPHEDQRQQQGQRGAHDPQRDAVGQPSSGHGLATPMGRQVGLGRGPVLADQVGQALAHAVELGAAVVDDPVASLETQGQHTVQQFQQWPVGGHVLGQLRQQLEDFLAAPGFVVELHQQALLVPAGLGAPGGVGHGLVQRGAQYITRSHHRALGHAGLLRLRLETLHRRYQRSAQCRHLGRLGGLAQAGDQAQQRAGGGHQGVEQSYGPHVHAHVHGRTGGRRHGRCRRWRGTCGRTRARLDDGPLGLEGGERVGGLLGCCHGIDLTSE